MDFTPLTLCTLCHWDYNNTHMRARTCMQPCPNTHARHHCLIILQLCLLLFGEQHHQQRHFVLKKSIAHQFKRNCYLPADGAAIHLSKSISQLQCTPDSKSPTSAGGEPVHLARVPYANPDLGVGPRTTRFVALAPAANTTKQKALHALSLVPAQVGVMLSSTTLQSANQAE